MAPVQKGRVHDAFQVICVAYAANNTWVNKGRGSIEPPIRGGVKVPSSCILGTPEQLVGREVVESKVKDVGEESGCEVSHWSRYGCRACPEGMHCYHKYPVKGVGKEFWSRYPKPPVCCP